MYIRGASVIFAVLVAASAASAQDRSAAKEQVDFGIKVAQSGLWREAQYRWERAVELDATYAEAWNNLAIAYEHAGKFDDARKAYETAIKLDPKNMLIRQNYDLFKEINDRTQKRRGGR
jgi:Flp pilus assembly protein TadD